MGRPHIPTANQVAPWAPGVALAGCSALHTAANGEDSDARMPLPGVGGSTSDAGRDGTAAASNDASAPDGVHCSGATGITDPTCNAPPLAVVEVGMGWPRLLPDVDLGSAPNRRCPHAVDELDWGPVGETCSESSACPEALASVENARGECCYVVYELCGV